MEFIFKTKDPQLDKLLRSSFFFELRKLLEEVPTLRRLKEVLGSKTEKNLEKLIDNGVVERKDRRYSLSVPVVSVEETVLEKWENSLLDFFDGKKQTEIFSILEQILASEPSEYFYQFSGEDDCYRKTVANNEMRVISLSLKEWDLTLPCYFDALSREEEERYTEVYDLIGDVSSEYYLDQVQVVVEKILNQRRRIRPTIFVESMKFFGLIEKDPLVLTTPVLKERFPIPFIEEIDLLEIWERRTIVARLLKRLKQENVTIIYFNL